jgi:hypothetical protein
MYRTLDAGKIIETIDLLKARIDERFPGADLGKVAGALSEAACDTARKAKALANPDWLLRLLLPALFVTICGGIVFLIMSSLPPRGPSGNPLTVNVEPTNLLQTLEATINTIVLAGIAIVFLYTVTTRIKRHQALKALHQLRSLVHVVDMHQLTKDPSLILVVGPETPASPKREMTPFELGRYLDYCSEMLSLTGKVAALYAQDLDDPVVIEAVNDIEMLAANLSRKIWQKMAILQVAIDSALVRAS